MNDRRPDPDVLLQRLQEAESRAARGKLKIFFGASPGVGKTYAMLEEARARKAEGLDVVVGVVETHGRAETASLLRDLEALPRKSIEYRGVTLEEFDLDAALTRRPVVVLVDELAHTNVPGSRHTKRWQDVEELLTAGVSVYSTLNVQHLESLNDVVAQITGVQVRETVPDSIFDEADQIELADLSAEDLLRRLQQGKVYVAEQAARAIDRFFRRGNLIALRELALRRVAERVDAQMRGYMQEHGIRETWPAGDRLLVCVGPNPDTARLIRAGKRMATTLECEWIAAYVETPAVANLSAADREALAENLQLAEELEGTVVTLSGHNAAEEILAYARDHNVTKILAGKPTHPRWRDKIFGSMLDQLVRGSGSIDVYVISGEEEGRAPAGRAVVVRRSPPREYGWAVLVVALCTLFGWVILRRLTVTDVAMAYLVGAAVVAARFGRGPSVLASVLGIACFDFFFVPPAFTFAVSDLRYLLTFVVMLGVSLLISGLTVRIREQAVSARERERRTATLYVMSREFAATRGIEDLLAATTRHLQSTFGSAVAVLLPDAHGHLGAAQGTTPGYPLDEKELSVAAWVLQRGQPAGFGTDTLPAASALYLPLNVSGKTVGVLGVRAQDAKRFQDPAQRQLLETFAGLIGAALDRTLLAEKGQKVQLEVEAERLRTSLLSSLSHDLRTPLGSITGAASSLLQDSGAMPELTKRGLLQAIQDEAERMNRLIGNLLSMIRVETGTLQVQKDWQPLEDTIGVALIRLDERIRDHPVQVTLPPDLPLAFIDGILLEQVFINLLENAVKYTPPGSPIEISAAVENGVLTVEVADRGPGLPKGEESRIFDKFYRITGAAAAGGVGLGLTICRGIITAHGGRIWAENRAGGGAVFKFTLPAPTPPPEPPPAEAMEPGAR